MTGSELGALLKTTELPVKYLLFRDPPKPPYLVYLATGSDNFSADDRVYAKITEYSIELYSNNKDLISEGKVEDVLDGADIYYDKLETYIPDEKLYQVVYSITI